MHIFERLFCGKLSRLTALLTSLPFRTLACRKTPLTTISSRNIRKRRSLHLHAMMWLHVKIRFRMSGILVPYHPAHSHASCLPGAVPEERLLPRRCKRSGVRGGGAESSFKNSNAQATSFVHTISNATASFKPHGTYDTDSYVR